MRPRLDGHAVHALGAPRGQVVLDGSWRLSGDVLNERSAERDVPHLYAPADGERGDPGLEGGAGERDLVVVTGRVRPAGGRVRGLTETRGIDVLAASQDEPRDVGKRAGGELR